MFPSFLSRWQASTCADVAKCDRLLHYTSGLRYSLLPANDRCHQVWKIPLIRLYNLGFKRIVKDSMIHYFNSNKSKESVEEYLDQILDGFCILYSFQKPTILKDSLRIHRQQVGIQNEINEIEIEMCQTGLQLCLDNKEDRLKQTREAL